MSLIIYVFFESKYKNIDNIHDREKMLCFVLHILLFYLFI